MLRMRGLMAVILLSFFSVAFAADDEAAPASDYVGYVELKPFTVNFGGPGVTRFLKCEVSIAVGSEATLFAINHHMAHVRNDLVFLYSGQTAESVDSIQAQTELAKLSLKVVQDLIVEEEGEAMISDLFFTSFVVQ